MTIIYNTLFQEETNLEAEWQEAAREMLKFKEFGYMSNKERPPEESLDRMAREISRMPTGASSKMRDVTDTPGSAISPNRVQKQLDMQKVYVVRLPVVKRNYTDLNPLAEVKMFFYIRSIYPQSYWIRRCTTLTFEHFEP